MDRNQARERALAKTKKTLKREVLEPEELDEDFAIRTDEGGNTIDERLQIRELSGAESMEYSKDMEKFGNKTALGNMLVKVILLPGSLEPLFNPTDRDAVLEYGTSKLLPIQYKVMRLSGLPVPDDIGLDGKPKPKPQEEQTSPNGVPAPTPYEAAKNG